MKYLVTFQVIAEVLAESPDEAAEFVQRGHQLFGADMTEPKILDVQEAEE